jgi:hypothetical protein
MKHLKPGHIKQPRRRRFLMLGASSALIAARFLMPSHMRAQQGGYQLSDDPTTFDAHTGLGWRAFAR